MLTVIDCFGSVLRRNVAPGNGGRLLPEIGSIFEEVVIFSAPWLIVGYSDRQPNGTAEHARAGAS